MAFRKSRPRAADQPDRTSAEHNASPHALATWQITVLAFAGVIVLLGGALWAYAAMAGGDAPVAADTQAERSDGIASGFAPEQNGANGDSTPLEPDQPADPFALDDFSPALFRLGFSFFVGFAIAYALRSFLKITLIAIGLMLLGLFGLQYVGVVSVDWTAMQSHYETAMQWLQQQTADFTKFVQGYLPSAASAAGGFFVGFRRRG